MWYGNLLIYPKLVAHTTLCASFYIQSSILIIAAAAEAEIEAEAEDIS
jgi:hypothetical protein